ncbi:MAG TPA: ROK family protein [Planctomycetota bacterium]|nr:ROK family protein [Planctomycetota bacterium]
MTGKDREGPTTLCIDVGGTGLKAMLVDAAGRPASERRRIPTPKPSVPEAVFPALAELCGPLTGYDRVSLGFPGVVVGGVAKNAANLGPAWSGVDLEAQLRKLFGKPARALNDADLQGYGLVEGRGVELVVTLGTGVGGGLFHEGRLVPNLEIGHAPFEKGKTFEERLGLRALEKCGKRRWRKRLDRAVEIWRRTFNFDRLHLGGGNAALLEGRPMPPDVRIGANVAGLLGGVALWRGAT